MATLTEKPLKAKRSPKHKLTQSGKGWFKRIGPDVKWICSLKAAPTGADADAVFEAKFDSLCSPEPVQVTTLTVADLSDMFLLRKREERDAGNLDDRTVEDYESVIQMFNDVVGDDLAVDELTPSDFGRFRSKIASYSVHRRAKQIINVRTMMNWGFAMRLLTRPPDYGPDFRPPSRSEFRKARAKREAETGHQLYTPEQVGKLLAHPPTWNMRAMILLALNGGFGNTDLAELKWASISDGWIRYRRGKTGIPRAVPLWPETIAALDQVKYPASLGGERPDDGTVFLTRQGLSLIRGTKDAVAVSFTKLCEAEDVNVPCHGFYSLRRTFRTVADATGDTRAIARIMGHEVGDMADVYVQDVSSERLQRVVDHVRDALRISDALSVAQAADAAAASKRSEAAKEVRRRRSRKASRAKRGGKTGTGPAPAQDPE